jgi:hypothetical protein
MTSLPGLALQLEGPVNTWCRPAFHPALPKHWRGSWQKASFSGAVRIGSCLSAARSQARLASSETAEAEVISAAKARKATPIVTNFRFI